MTERKMIIKEQTTLDIDGRLLKDVIKNLTALLEQYGDKAQISKETYHYEEGTYLALMLPVPETDAEMAYRLNLEQQSKEAREKRDRAEYERLAAKFAQESKQ